MDVIRHQAIAQNAKSMTGGLFGEQRQIAASLAVGKENLLAVIPPLRDVVRCADRHHASDTRHVNSLPRPAPVVKIEAVPFLCGRRSCFVLVMAKQGARPSGLWNRISRPLAGVAGLSAQPEFFHKMLWFNRIQIFC